MLKNIVFITIWSLFLLPILTVSAEHLPCVRSGNPHAVEEKGGQWSRHNGYLQNSGNVYLLSAKSIGPGDFQVNAKLSIHNLEGSAASFV
ncbi:hypothetical protein GF373_09360, partial [bacterium]|nr:hypothetical protein [bacterium]